MCIFIIYRYMYITHVHTLTLSHTLTHRTPTGRETGHRPLAKARQGLPPPPLHFRVLLYAKRCVCVCVRACVRVCQLVTDLETRSSTHAHQPPLPPPTLPPTTPLKSFCELPRIFDPEYPPSSQVTTKVQSEHGGLVRLVAKLLCNSAPLSHPILSQTVLNPAPIFPSPHE